jgi:hypothetical protein
MSSDYIVLSEIFRNRRVTIIFYWIAKFDLCDWLVENGDWHYAKSLDSR